MRHDHTPAPVVPDETLDALAETFQGFGGSHVLGITFEEYVRWQVKHRADARMYARALQRQSIDRRCV